MVAVVALRVIKVVRRSITVVGQHVCMRSLDQMLTCRWPPDLAGIETWEYGAVWLFKKCSRYLSRLDTIIFATRKSHMCQLFGNPLYFLVEEILC